MPRHVRILSSIAFLLFSLLVLMLCWYSRLATDDYYFIWEVREKGVLGSVHAQYMEWCGRYGATLLMDLVYLMDTDQTWYFLYPLFCFLALILGVRYGFYVLFKQAGIVVLSQWLLTFAFTGLLFFLGAAIGETWFWYCSLSS